MKTRYKLVTKPVAQITSEYIQFFYSRGKSTYRTDKLPRISESGTTIWKLSKDGVLVHEYYCGDHGFNFIF